MMLEWPFCWIKLKNIFKKGNFCSILTVVFLTHRTFFDFSICSTLYLLVTNHDRVGLNHSVEGVLCCSACALHAWTAGIAIRQRARLAVYTPKWFSPTRSWLGSSASRLVYSPWWSSDQKIKRWAYWEVKKCAMRQKNNSEYRAKDFLF